MNSKESPWLQAFMRSEFARGRKANTALRVMAEIQYFADFLQCQTILETEKALEANLVDLKRKKPFKDADVRAYNLLNDFHIYLSDSGYKVNSRTHAVFLVGKFIRTFNLFIWNDERFQEIVQLPTNEEAEDVDLTRREILLILKYCSPKTRRRVLALLASGLNPIDLSKLKVKNVYSDEAIVRIDIARSKTNVKLETFMTPEAWSESLKFSPVNSSADLEV
ncbi:MAG: hypothetical protein OK457_06595, partial [Thaumarchaeota archaeon]|nr:hypothetical protein [Nitrososphaerota archaeon]